MTITEDRLTTTSPAPPSRLRLALVALAVVALVVGGAVEGLAKFGISGSSPAIVQGVISSVGGGVPYGGQGCVNGGPCGTFVQQAGVKLQSGEHISYFLVDEAQQAGPFIVVVSPSS